MKPLDTIRSLGQEIQSATRVVTDRLAEARAQIAAAQRALQHAQGAPAPPDEVKAAFARWVDETAAYQAKESAPNLVRRFGAPPGAHVLDRGAPWGPGAELTWGFATLLLGPELKARFADLVDATPYEAGPAVAARPGLVERLTREVADLGGAEERLVDEAAAAGVVVEHRPEVVTRRQQEARSRERAAAAEADRAAREAAINAQHTRTRQVAPSPYLGKAGSPRYGDG